MDDLDRRILDALQQGVPLVVDPYARLAARLDSDAETVFGRVTALVADGAIRRLGPSWDSRRLGFVATLVALRLPPERVAEVAEIVNRYDEVTHNYERRDRWNLWFTLIARDEARIAEILDRLRRDARIAEADMMNLPAERLLKIKVQFPANPDV